MFEKLLILIVKLLIMWWPLMTCNIQILCHMRGCYRRLVIYSLCCLRRLNWWCTIWINGCIESPTGIIKMLVINHGRCGILWAWTICTSFRRGITRRRWTPPCRAAKLRRWGWAIATEFNSLIIIIASSAWRLAAATVLLLFLPFGPTILKPNLNKK